MAVAASALRFDLFLNDKTAKGADSASSRLKKLAGVGIAFAGAGAAIGSTINKAAEFDKTIRVAGAAADASGAELKSMSDLALKMGTNTQFGAQGAADAMVELSKSGLTVAEQKAGVLVETMNLASAGGLELGNAATYMTNALNTFGLKAGDAAQVSTALAGGANASTASVESLGLALAQVGPGAKNAGLSLQDTVGVLAAFDQAGIKGSDAGTSLKTMLTRLTPTSTKAAKEMKRLGLNFTDAKGKFKSITEVAEILRQKFKGMTQEQRNTSLATIFGSDATRAASILINDGAKGIGKYIAATKDRGALEKQTKAQTDGAAGAMKKFKSAIDTLQITLAQRLLPAVSDAVGALSNFINKVSSKVGPAVDKVSGIFDKKLKPVFSGIKDTISKSLDGIDFSGLGKKLTTDAQGWSSNIIGGVQKGFEKGDWSGVGKAVGTGIRNAGDIAFTLTTWLGDQIEKINWGDLGVKAGKMAPTLLIGLAIGILNFDLGSALSTLGDHWFEVILGVLTIAFAPERVVGALAKVLAKIPFAGKLLAWLLTGIHAGAGRLVSAAGDLLGSFGAGFASALERVFPALEGRLVGSVDKLIYELRFKGIQFADTASGWVRSLLGGLASAPGSLAGKAGELIGGFVGGLARGSARVDKWAGGFGARTVSAVGDLSGSLYRVGVDFIQGFINGIKAKFGDVMGTVGDLGSAAGNFLKKTLHIGSPSKLTLKYGQWFSEGFSIGITNGKPQVEDAVNSLVDKLRDQLQAVRDFAKGIKDAFKSFGNVTSIDTLITDAQGKQSDGGFATLLEQLKQRVAAAKTFASTIAKLRKLGLNDSTLGDLRDAGPDQGLKAAQQLLASGVSGIKDVNSLTSQLALTAKDFSEREAKNKFGFGTKSPTALLTQDKQTVRLEVDLGSGGDEFVQALRKAIRVKGGDVQVVLGSKKAAA